MSRSTTDIDKKIGERVRLARMERGMSQEKLADAIGVTFQQVQKYEKGTNRISAGRLEPIAQALGRSISFFLRGDGERKGAAREDEDIVSRMLLAGPRGIALAESFLALPSSLQIKAADLVQDIVAMHREAQGVLVRQEAAE